MPRGNRPSFDGFSLALAMSEVSPTAKRKKKKGAKCPAPLQRYIREEVRCICVVEDSTLPLHRRAALSSPLQFACCHMLLLSVKSIQVTKLSLQSPCRVVRKAAHKNLGPIGLGRCKVYVTSQRRAWHRTRPCSNDQCPQRTPCRAMARMVCACGSV